MREKGSLIFMFSPYFVFFFYFYIYVLCVGHHKKFLFCRQITGFFSFLVMSDASFL